MEVERQDILKLKESVVTAAGSGGRSESYLAMLADHR
jgi:hypothetical protein